MFPIPVENAFLGKWRCNEILGLCMQKPVKESGVCIYVIPVQGDVGSAIGFCPEASFWILATLLVIQTEFNIIFLGNSMWILRRVEIGHEY